MRLLHGGLVLPAVLDLLRLTLKFWIVMFHQLILLPLRALLNVPAVDQEQVHLKYVSCDGGMLNSKK